MHGPYTYFIIFRLLDILLCLLYLFKLSHKCIAGIIFICFYHSTIRIIYTIKLKAFYDTCQLSNQFLCKMHVQKGRVYFFLQPDTNHATETKIVILSKFIICYHKHLTMFFLLQVYNSKANTTLQFLLLSALCCQVTIVASSYLKRTGRFQTHKKLCFVLLGKFFHYCNYIIDKLLFFTTASRDI